MTTADVVTNGKAARTSKIETMESLHRRMTKPVFELLGPEARFISKIPRQKLPALIVLMAFSPQPLVSASGERGGQPIDFRHVPLPNHHCSINAGGLERLSIGSAR